MKTGVSDLVEMSIEDLYETMVWIDWRLLRHPIAIT
jgi:hypothetical protein